jgi:pantoate--beta-alanine ligase
MILFKRSEDLLKNLENLRTSGVKTGFVPTMGALHEGHIELIDVCRRRSDYCICSIFVNPAQFNDPEDFKKYPKSLENDIEMLEKAGTDVLFIPSVDEIYPNGDKNLETYDLGTLETLLEGFYRPGHFQGVCQVMSRLLQLVKPDYLFMGQKDYQQCLVVKRLINLIGLTIEFEIVPTVREPEGLALSSRNRRLTGDQRLVAETIFAILNSIKKKIKAGDTRSLTETAIKKLSDSGFRTDYVSIARQNDLQAVENWDGRELVVALIAAFLGEVRLIDNLLLN